MKLSSTVQKSYDTSGIDEETAGVLVDDSEEFKDDEGSARIRVDISEEPNHEAEAKGVKFLYHGFGQGGADPLSVTERGKAFTNLSGKGLIEVYLGLPADTPAHRRDSLLSAIKTYFPDFNPNSIDPDFLSPAPLPQTKKADTADWDADEPTKPGVKPASAPAFEPVKLVEGKSLSTGFLNNHRSKIFAAMGALLAGGALGAAFYANRPQEMDDSRVCEGPNDAELAYLASLPEDGECVEEETPCEASPVEPTTLYGKVEVQMPSKDTRLTAAATNELVSGLYADANSYQDLGSPWRDSKLALDLVVEKLEKWRGYDAVLASLDASPTPITNLDDALAHIASDENLDSVDDPNNSDQTALALAKQIALIKDSRIAEDPAQAEAELAKITPEQVKETVASFVATPPPSPAHFQYPSAQSASLYDAPEPMNLGTATDLTQPTPVLVEFVPEQSNVYDAPEPMNFASTSVVEDEELALDEDEDLTDYLVEEEVLPISTPAQMGLASVVDIPEAHAIQVAKAPVIAPAPKVAPAPEPSFTQKATAAVKGWASKIGGWFK